MTDTLININGESIQTLEIIFLTTLISLMPSLVVMMSSFTRYIISLSFLRTALGTQQTLVSRKGDGVHAPVLHIHRQQTGAHEFHGLFPFAGAG